MRAELAVAVLLSVAASAAVAQRGDAGQRTPTSATAVLRAVPQDARPAFEQLDVKIEPRGLRQFGQIEELRIEATGQCWYKVQRREAKLNVAARGGAVIGHMLPSDRVLRLNRLLKATEWLSAPGAEGREPRTDPPDLTTVTLTLRKGGPQRSVVCQGERAKPYEALLHELHSVAVQERAVYLYEYVGGEDGARAWADVGGQVASLRGDPVAKSPYEIDYRRYLPMARRIVRDFYSHNDADLVPAVRLVGTYKVSSEVAFVHRMAHDRSMDLRREVAWALGRIHHPDSLPVLASMMQAQGVPREVGFELIRWGDAAVPHIVALIALSTNDKLERRENIVGESMVRAYLDHWDRLGRKIDARVVAAVRAALANKDPMNGLISTNYHLELLRRTVGRRP